ncbi:MAG: hypothetical protein GC147_07365 [Porphyrobacter sp.]|nr:hypothetical protein [Porphyrobacter sp.]
MPKTGAIRGGSDTLTLSRAWIVPLPSDAQRTPRALWTRALPGGVVAVAALALPEFSVGAGDLPLFREDRLPDPAPVATIPLRIAAEPAAFAAPRPAAPRPAAREVALRLPPAPAVPVDLRTPTSPSAATGAAAEAGVAITVAVRGTDFPQSASEPNLAAPVPATFGFMTGPLEPAALPLATAALGFTVEVPLPEVRVAPAPPSSAPHAAPSLAPPPQDVVAATVPAAPGIAFEGAPEMAPPSAVAAGAPLVAAAVVTAGAAGAGAERLAAMTAPASMAAPLSRSAPPPAIAVPAARAPQPGAAAPAASSPVTPRSAAPALAGIPRAGVAASAPGLGTSPLDIRSQLLTRIDGKTAGKLDFQQTASGLSVRLGSLAEIMGDRIDPAMQARIRASSSANAYLPLAELQAKGIPISYDPVYDEFNIGRVDTRPGAARKVTIDQISAPERGIRSVGIAQVPRGR